MHHIARRSFVYYNQASFLKNPIRDFPSGQSRSRQSHWLLNGFGSRDYTYAPGSTIRCCRRQMWRGVSIIRCCYCVRRALIMMTTIFTFTTRTTRVFGWRFAAPTTTRVFRLFVVSRWSAGRFGRVVTSIARYRGRSMRYFLWRSVRCSPWCAAATVSIYIRWRWMMLLLILILVLWFLFRMPFFTVKVTITPSSLTLSSTTTTPSIASKEPVASSRWYSSYSS